MEFPGRGGMQAQGAAHTSAQATTISVGLSACRKSWHLILFWSGKETFLECQISFTPTFYKCLKISWGDQNYLEFGAKRAKSSSWHELHLNSSSNGELQPKHRKSLETMKPQMLSPSLCPSPRVHQATEIKARIQTPLAQLLTIIPAGATLTLLPSQYW